MQLMTTSELSSFIKNDKHGIEGYENKIFPFVYC